MRFNHSIFPGYLSDAQAIFREGIIECLGNSFDSFAPAVQRQDLAASADQVQVLASAFARYGKRDNTLYEHLTDKFLCMPSSAVRYASSSKK